MSDLMCIGGLRAGERFPAQGEDRILQLPERAVLPDPSSFVEAGEPYNDHTLSISTYIERRWRYSSDQRQGAQLDIRCWVDSSLDIRQAFLLLLETYEEHHSE